MGKNTLMKYLKNSTNILGLRGSLRFPTILNKMELLKGKNKIIIEVARAMIYGQNLSISFWSQNIQYNSLYSE